MLLCAPKLVFLLLAIFQVISWEKFQIVAQHTITPSPSFQLSTNLQSTRAYCYYWQFRCDDGWQCIDRYQLCDGFYNCYDGSDELHWNCQTASSSLAIAPSSTITSITQLCSHGSQFSCPNGGVCIPNYWLCDGYNDCGDNSDEMSQNCNSSSSSLAIAPSSTIPSASLLTSIHCAWSEFLCANGRKCIPTYWVCDWYDDCGDNSDEMSQNCNSSTLPLAIAPSSAISSSRLSTKIHCSWSQFPCSNGVRCIYSSWLCDGDNDCGDNSDELWQNCHNSRWFSAIRPSSAMQSIAVSSYCHYWQFRCNNGQCVQQYYVCDGWNHCYDGSDEWYWNCPISTTPVISPSQTISTVAGKSSITNSCYYGQFRCHNGECIYQSAVCDGIPWDCTDGSDEELCSSGNSSKCQSKVDLGFILDSSGSVPYNDFQRMKAFVKDLTNFFKISADETRVSVMIFSSNAAISIYFHHVFSDKSYFDRAVDNIGYTGGGTATAVALNLAYTRMFNRHYGARGAEVKKVLVILTDGRSNSGMVSDPARQLKNAGVVIFSVGIGSSLSMYELQAMASEPTNKHVIRLDNFSQLPVLAKQMSAWTCNASHFLVFCGKDIMTAVFERADLPKHVNIDKLYLRDERCTASYNSTHVVITTPLTGCGTLYKETEQMMFFTNTLSERSNKHVSGGVITRNYLFSANFTCSYGRKRTVGTFSFEPAKQRVSVSLSGGGNFTFAMDFYKSSSFQEPYTIYDYPVFKSLSDFIYIQYSVNTTNFDLVVHAETCRATPTNRPYDNPQYVFIADGCANDTTIQHYGYGMASVQRFKIQAFRFLTQHRFVYIHCDLVICNRNYLNSTCARGKQCPRRFRRGVNKMSSSDDSSRMYPLSLGPMMYSEDSDNDKSTGNSDAMKANYPMIGSLVGIGCLAFVLAGALVYVMKRGRLRRVSPVPITNVLPMEEKAESSG